MSTSLNLSSVRVAVIGAGNLGQSMALGWAMGGEIPAAHITCTRRQLHLLDDLAAAGIQVTEDTASAVRGADIVILASSPSRRRRS
ncbi:MAG: NAD(P)-binding domain-containing protein [Bacteroidia bacterium]